jgi:hypothetical protein
MEPLTWESPVDFRRLMWAVSGGCAGVPDAWYPFTAGTETWLRCCVDHRMSHWTLGHGSPFSHLLPGCREVLDGYDHLSVAAELEISSTDILNSQGTEFLLRNVLHGSRGHWSLAIDCHKSVVLMGTSQGSCLSLLSQWLLSYCPTIPLLSL